MLKKFLFLIVCALSILLLRTCESPSQFEDPRPNFLIILTDDQRFDTMQYMPKTQGLIFDQGVNFPHAYITTSLCCPSRSSILTGMYAHNHGVLDNNYELDKKTFFEYLHENGYTTALVGKYLNTWKGEMRPEFDYWVSFQYGETRYLSPRLNVNGEWIRHTDQYTTYIFGDYAMEFLDQAAKKNNPFVLLLAVNAPHNPVTPALEDESVELTLPERRPNFNEEDLTDKPSWMSMKDDPLAGGDTEQLDLFRRNQILTLIALDRTIEKVLAKLEDTGEMENTMIIFLSDNGVHWGEHRLVKKNSIYEESVRTPFAIRYPPLIPKPYIEHEIVANIDIAPTLLDLAGISIPVEMDGLSLVNLLNHQGEWREGVLLEGWPPRGEYYAIHTERYVYAETQWDDTLPVPETPQYELYDLVIDPYQMENIVGDPQYEDLMAHLRGLLEQEKNR